MTIEPGIYTNGGGESDAYRAANYGPLGCCENFALWGGNWDRDGDGMAEAGGKERSLLWLQRKKNRGPDYAGAMHVDQEGPWSWAFKVGPRSPVRWARLLDDYEMILDGCRENWPSATFSLYLPPFEWGSGDAVEHQFNTIMVPFYQRLAPKLDFFMSVMYRSGNEIGAVHDARYARILRHTIRAAVMFDKPCVAHISDRTQPGGSMDDSVLWTAGQLASQLALIRDTDVDGRKVDAISSWKAPEQFFRDAFETTADGSWKRIGAMHEQMRRAFTAEGALYGFDPMNMLERTEHFEKQATLYYKQINDEMGYAAEPPVCVPPSALDLLAQSGRDLSDAVDAACAANDVVLVETQRHTDLIEAVQAEAGGDGP